MLTWPADQGRTWSTPRSISVRGDNYFPELGVDPATGVLVGAWYTNRFDPSSTTAKTSNWSGSATTARCPAPAGDQDLQPDRGRPAPWAGRSSATAWR